MHLVIRDKSLSNQSESPAVPVGGEVNNFERKQTSLLTVDDDIIGLVD